MADPLTVTMLPAKEGDCLVVQYGPTDARKAVLIDGGRAWTYRHALKGFLAEHAITRIELLVVTHVDRDHIDGVLSLVKDRALDLEVRHIWFNTYDHLIGGSIEVVVDDDLEQFGAKMGEALSPLIVEKGWRWNEQFAGAAVKVSDDASARNQIALGELEITLLSPDQHKLDELATEWKKECEAAGITPGASLDEYEIDEDDDLEAFGPMDIEALAATPFSGDHSEANGSSIGFVLEYDGRRVLFAGDAHADLLKARLEALGATPAAPYAVDAFKIPHHGSKANVSRELLALLECKHFLVSTNGNYFKHPDDVAMARLVKFGTAGATVHFNYETQHNDYWRNPTWERQYDYAVEYPDADSDGFKTIVL